MSQHSAPADVAEASVYAVITRADGSKRDLGRIAHYVRPATSFWAKAKARLEAWALLGAIVLAGAMGASLGATVVTNTGHAIVTNRIIGAGTIPQHIAWGTGAGTAAATDTTLFTESTEEARTSGTTSRQTTTVTNDTFRVVGTITVATSNKTITNVGLFDASTSGNLYFKSDFTGLALLIGDSITFTINVRYG
jgi:hypothetical protein